MCAGREELERGVSTDRGGCSPARPRRGRRLVLISVAAGWRRARASRCAGEEYARYRMRAGAAGGVGGWRCCTVTVPDAVAVLRERVLDALDRWPEINRVLDGDGLRYRDLLSIAGWAGEHAGSACAGPHLERGGVLQWTRRETLVGPTHIVVRRRSEKLLRRREEELGMAPS